ncbi:calcium/sodium antiporter [Candidatus Saccharibacteria bacterium]|nr:calcium/sodium antiporter [Candidatus Saccharibacteria bacterium]MBR2989785.1 calcium/sodium antiporter [Candidatus Saccharibacteria bacterium]
MEVIPQILLLIVGFVLLIKGADFFVDGASSTASNFKVPKILIGLTIIAFGTSAPELAVSIKALASGNTDMVLGNVIGSNILNILLILGIAAMIRPLRIRKNTIRKEIPITVLVSTLLVTLFLDIQLNHGDTNQISRGDGIAILLFFAIFLYYLINMALHDRDKTKVEKPKWKLGLSLLFTALGLVGIIFGSDMVVNSATAIATHIGISERIISLTVIALGTSLPELVTTIVSAKKGETELVLGNILGSNIFNICMVLGIPVAIFGGITPASFQILDLVMLVSSAILLFVFSITQHKISRAEGLIMFLAFAGYYTAIFFI